MLLLKDRQCFWTEFKLRKLPNELECLRNTFINPIYFVSEISKAFENQNYFLNYIILNLKLIKHNMPYMKSIYYAKIHAGRKI